jgi:hypothetical protein
LAAPVEGWIAVTEWEAFREETNPAIPLIWSTYIYGRRIFSVNWGVMRISITPWTPAGRITTDPWRASALLESLFRLKFSWPHKITRCCGATDQRDDEDDR